MNTRSITCLLLCAVVCTCVACGGGSGYESPFKPVIPGGSDADAGTPADTQLSDGSQPSDQPPIATGTWPSGTWSEPVLIETTSGRSPSVHFSAAGHLLLLYNDDDPPDEYRRALFQRVWKSGEAAPGAAVKLNEGGGQTILWADAKGSELIATGHLLFDFFKSADGGESWTFSRSLGAADSQICNGNGPAYVGADDQSRFLLIEFAHNTGLFGCVSWSYLLKHDGDRWVQPALQLETGSPRGVVVKGQSVLVLTRGGLLASQDGGAQFAKLDGSGLPFGLGGDAIVSEPAGTVYLFQVRDTGSGYVLGLIVGKNFGESWTYQVLVRSKAVYFPRVARDGQRLVVAYTATGEAGQTDENQLHAYLIVSDDLGATWSTPQRVSKNSADVSVSELGIALRDKAIAVIYSSYGYNAKPQNRVDLVRFQ